MTLLPVSIDPRLRNRLVVIRSIDRRSCPPSSAEVARLRPYRATGGVEAEGGGGGEEDVVTVVVVAVVVVVVVVAVGKRSASLHSCKSTPGPSKCGADRDFWCDDDDDDAVPPTYRLLLRG